MDTRGLKPTQRSQLLPRFCFTSASSAENTDASLVAALLSEELYLKKNKKKEREEETLTGWQSKQMGISVPTPPKCTEST